MGHSVAISTATLTANRSTAVHLRCDGLRQDPTYVGPIGCRPNSISEREVT
jgi:hypothetical protein